MLTFDGPEGQSCASTIPLIPGFKRVTSKVLDHLQRLVNNDPTSLLLVMDCIAVAGRSMGGYYALREAMDPRIKACMSVEPLTVCGKLLRHECKTRVICDSVAAGLDSRSFFSISLSEYTFVLTFRRAGNSRWGNG